MKQMISKSINIAWLLVLTNSAIAATQNCSQPTIMIRDNYRYIISNGLSCEHGQFPNSHNPNSIRSQSYHFRVPINPTANKQSLLTNEYLFGVALDGIPFDPGTAEWWNNDRSSGWNYAAMTGFTNLGLDENHAHVQPDGSYHYHGLPMDLYNQKHSKSNYGFTLIGYAADGFPIYAIHGLKDPSNLQSGMKTLMSSYQLKKGTRPSGPGGQYDGRFVQDFEYTAGHGDLDQCNGRFGKTPDYPNGTYQYYITNSFPFVPRCFMGTPDRSFVKRRPNNSRGSHPRHHHRPPSPRHFNTHRPAGIDSSAARPFGTIGQQFDTTRDTSQSFQYHAKEFSTDPEQAPIKLRQGRHITHFKQFQFNQTQQFK